MTHIVHPFSHRLGIIRDWKSRWFGDKANYRVFLKSDVLLREYLVKKLRPFHVASIETERSKKTLRLIIRTSRPGMIIGRSGEGAQKLRAEIIAFARKKKLSIPDDFKIDIEEVRSPEANAAIVAKMVAEGLEKRLPFRGVMRQALEKVMANRDVKGAKIALSGRLGGAEMGRNEELKKGGIPLQTFRADIDFAREKAYLSYGVIGVKVWIYKGEVFDKKV